MMNIYEEIQKLIQYSIDKKLIEKEDEVLIRNRILETLKLEDYIKYDVEVIDKYPCDILNRITKWARENGRLEQDMLVYEDLLNSKIMGQIIQRPSYIRKKFFDIYEDSRENATNSFYEFAKKSNYIRTDRISKNISFIYKSKYGDLDITINLSKPEKDPREIAALAKMGKNSSYPKTLLDVDNEGYSGRIDHPGRQNLRVVEIELLKEKWYFQYSPYIYYNEHSIVLSHKVRNMVINTKTFKRLLEFLDIFPHYFIGSNADLPIVGGSILNHDHYQAGRYKFPIEVATKKLVKKIDDVYIYTVNWPLTVIRLNSKNKESIANLSSRILEKWINYNDSQIVSHTGNTRHNTITPIARIIDGQYEMDLVLRNNLTNDTHPLGIYHPHEQYHNIKKENIGLIEVMGLAVLPARLKDEMEKIKNILAKVDNLQSLIEKMKEDESLLKHINWINNYVNDDNIDKIDLNKCIGDTFEHVLENCGVLDNNRLLKFINELQ